MKAWALHERLYSQTKFVVKKSGAGVGGSDGRVGEWWVG